jgi:prolyl-tRNA synthetase
MTSLASLMQPLAALSIHPAARVEHPVTTSDTDWRNALAGSVDGPKTFELVRTLVFKPKTAKGATTVPLVVFAREGTQTNAGALGKRMGAKELRLANDEFVQDFFGLDKNSRGCTVACRDDAS